MGSAKAFSLGQPLAKFLFYALLLCATVGLAWSSEALKPEREVTSQLNLGILRCFGSINP